MAVEQEEFVEIVKSRFDKREYRRVVLKNSLQVLLISDPDTDKCAASMDVCVGSHSDPEGLEGLAHFLEHMLFYASEKYPEEDSYSKFITEHGGSTNAFTGSENTKYFFDVNVDAFEEALDRFAQFFIKPLMSPDATMREIKAVDSVPFVTLALMQLQKHLSSEGHPFHKFDTGNWDTLEVLPKAKGLDTRDELIKFYQDHYSANLMNLVIYAKDDIDKLHALVDDKFQAIQNTDRNRIHFPGQPCLSEHLQILVKSVPIKEGHILTVIWPIVPEIRHYKEGPCRYLGHLIGHEGKGSLFHILKSLGWALTLCAGQSDWSMDYGFFGVVMNLTDAGHEHMQDIVGLLFKYISLLQISGVCQWIFHELSSICEAEFHYQDKIAPLADVVNISSNMEIYPIKDWIVGSSLPCQFHAHIIRMVLDQLTPDNVRIFWESKNFQGSTDMIEPWYGTAFSVENISSSQIKEWMESSPNKDLHMPEPNIFIPTDFSLKNEEEKIVHPVLLRKSSCSTLWFKPDTTFSTPKACLKIDFSCPHANESSEAEEMTYIFTRLLMDYLNEYAYYAQVAGLQYWVSHTNTGFQLTIEGYNHKLKILLEAVIEKIAKFEVMPDRFDVIKEVVMKGHQNMKFQQPCEQALYYCSVMLQENSRPWVEQLEVLTHILSEDLSRFIPKMLSRAFLECYVAGNIECGEAELMVMQLESMLFEGQSPVCRPLYPSQHLSRRAVKLKTGANYLFSTEGLNPSDENSALVHYIQVHQDDCLMNVKLQLLALIAKEPVFHQLRSVEQLGYVTALRLRNDFGVLGLQFIIQSTVKSPGHIDSRVEEFLKMFESKLYEMTNEEFKSNAKALIDLKLEKDKNIWEETRFYWSEISNGTLKFDRRESEVAMLRQLKKEDLLDFFEKYVKVGGPKKKTLSVRVYGNQHLSDYEAEKNQGLDPSLVQIGDIFAFQRSRPLYGSLKGVNGRMKL
ncbi:hypothetical protein MLD38_028795 [Melastoma candidum]|uniref:Uncharacterized protein n=1 Tax=Melastoma candidum TaxID=119954 RepID=A0ACB9N200_9MYRT|nr:hypothetical protein MLD38_028795 [Melastoma candidum]